MLRKYSSWLLVVLFLIAPATPVTARDRELTAEQAKIEIAKLGLGEKARATIS